MISFENVYYSYPTNKAGYTINNVSFKIVQGEMIAIVGSNGAGKTTLSKMLNGLIKPASGDVYIKGQNTKQTKTSVLAKSVGFLFQNPDRQICRNTVSEEIMMSLDCVGVEDGEERLKSVLEEFSLDGDANPFSLSRGQRQIVTLAALIGAGPEILILDEPTTGLDYKECMHIMHLVSELNKNGTTVIMVCHDMEVVLDFAKRVLVIANGELIADDTPRNIFANDEVMKKASLLPPQIYGLSKRLGNEFSDVYTVDEMTKRVAGLKGCLR